MRIPPFYIRQDHSDQSCSDTTTREGSNSPLYDSEVKCKNVGATWGYYPPYGWEDYHKQSHIPDEEGRDFYYTGIHRIGHDQGTHLPMNYKGEWVATQGTTTSEAYHKGDLVFVKPAAAGSLHPETIFYYCLIDNSDLSAPPSNNWEKQNLKSYLYEGVNSETEPGAYHAYDTKESKISHRYEEGGNATAREAEMGVTNVKIGQGGNSHFETWYNQENRANQFYVADAGHFYTYETCHGTRPVWLQGFSGNNNFYNATYPAGYYAPPHGEHATLTLVGSNPGEETINALTSTDFELEDFMAGDCCPSLDTKQELEMYGIRTVFPKNGAMVTFDQNRGDEHGIHAPYEECPPDLPPAVFFERELFGYHPGSIMAPGAGTFYNDNPFPNGLDIDGWFHPHVYETKRCWAPGGLIYNGYKLKGGYPELTYPVMGSNERKLDAGICKAREAETSQLLGYNFEGVQGGMGTGPGAAANDSASFATYDPFIYWHFIFRYNHDSLWDDTQNTLTNKVVNFGEGAGTIEDHLWEYRQCPSTPDFLPWSADCPIHACPSHYFDIPYYAAIGKFGFYGARFFNTCSVPAGVGDNEVQDPHAEFNYYSALKASADGKSFNDPPITLKGRIDRTDQVDFVGRINNECYKVTYEKTSTDDLPVDLVLGTTRPTWVDSVKTIDMVYYVYYWNWIGNLKQVPGAGVCSPYDSYTTQATCEANNGTWTKSSVDLGSIIVPMTACEDCANGGANAVDEAKKQVRDAWAALFGVTWESLQGLLASASGGGVGTINHISDTFCDDSNPNCLPFLKYGSVAFNPHNILDSLGACDDLLRTHAVRMGADNIGATKGQYSTFDQRVDLVRDFSAGVQECDTYSEPSVTAGTCGEDHYDFLLEIASNEQRINEFFVGNHGFFLWANYEHIINSPEYKNYLIGDSVGDPAEVHFKRCLFRLYSDFNQLLLSLPNFFDGNDSPVIYYEKAINGLYGNQALDYSRQGLFNDMLFSNNRYRQFLRELEWHDQTNLWNLAESIPGHVNQIEAWDRILKTYGHYIAQNGGAVNQGWYKEAIEAKESRILTRYVENKLRGKAIDLYPTNQISFSTDSADRYITGKYWGNSQWGHSTVGHYAGSSTTYPDPNNPPDGKLTNARFDPLPGGYGPQRGDPSEPNPNVTRTYFHGTYAAKSSVTGHFEDITNAKNGGGEHFYAGLFVDWSCGGDMPSTSYTAGGLAVAAEGKGIPKKPWVTKGHADVGKLNQGFSCFSPLFIQQPLNLSCKLGQRPTFMAHAVDYHTIPDDKINKGYPEIDYWTNNLKLTNSRGELKYPIKYQWYRMLRRQPDNNDALPPNGAYFNPPNPSMNETFDEWFYANEPVLQKASVTGEWSCMEGVSGVGTEDCTMFHPQVSYTHDMLEGDGKYEDKKEEGRQYREDHWTKLVDYKGELHNMGSVKKQGWQRIWKSWAYIQGSINAFGRNNGTDPYYGVKPNVDQVHQTVVAAEGAGPLDNRHAIPCFDIEAGADAYNKMMIDEYGINSNYGDEEYVYFCVASGRFGFRRSEYASLNIEDWLKLDVSIRNGAPMTIPMDTISFDYTRIDQDHAVFPGLPGENQISEIGDQALLNASRDKNIHKNCPNTESSYVTPYNMVFLKMGWGAPLSDHNRWQGNGLEKSVIGIPPFAGTMRDQNQAVEQEVMEVMNMSNNCRSFAFVGREGFRGATRTYRPPTQHNHQGTKAERAGWFEYGMLYSFGGVLSQAAGNALYSQPQLPVCRDYFMPKGCTAQGFRAGFPIADGGTKEQFTRTVTDICGQTTTVSFTESLSARMGNVDASEENALGGGDAAALAEGAASNAFHYTAGDRAIIITSLMAGVPTTRINHQGELYPWNENDTAYWYDTHHTIGHHGKGVSWQFSNNLGIIKRFGKCAPMPEGGDETYDWSAGNIVRTAETAAGFTSIISQGTAAHNKLRWLPKDTSDYFFWAWGNSREMMRGWRAAKQLIGPSTLAGIQCGFRQEGCGRYMLYFVEALHRYYQTCGESEKKKEINLSFIAPGLRHGAAGTNYFWGGFPSSTYVKRYAKVGPYAYEWRVSTHNRDRNGNGISESFYSTKYDRNMYLYDPPAIYGLWARQTDHLKTSPKIDTLRKLRRRAQWSPCQGEVNAKSGQPSCAGHTKNGYRAIPWQLAGLRFGPYGTSKNGGCGTMRLGCVDTPHLPRRRSYSSNSNEPCNWYKYAIKLGLDHGSHYGCNEKQLLEGVCFDPCLSMKYNYGFFPGGKLLTINNYVKYKTSRHDAEPPKGVANAAGGVLPNAGLAASKIPSKSSLNANKSPQAQKAQADSGVAGAVVKAANPSRFLTQLTNDVHDEEIAITKSKSMKFVRMLRGPWATPYRRIKAEIAAAGLGLPPGGRKTNSDVFNSIATPAIIGQTHEELTLGGAFYSQPDKVTSAQRYSDTSVSPCNAYGADHCNYLTPTIHIGMDTQFSFMTSDIMANAAYLGGQYSLSKEITVGGEMSKQFAAMAKWLAFFLIPGSGSIKGLAAAGRVGSLSHLKPHAISVLVKKALSNAKVAGQVATMSGLMEAYIDDNCGGDDSGFMMSTFATAVSWFLPNMPPTQLEGEIMQRSSSSMPGQLTNALMEQLDGMATNGQILII